jgi:hypothetical protein
MEPAVREQYAEVERALRCRTLGGDYQLKIEKRTPPMINDRGGHLIEKVAESC